MDKLHRGNTYATGASSSWANLSSMAAIANQNSRLPPFPSPPTWPTPFTPSLPLALPPPPPRFHVNRQMEETLILQKKAEQEQQPAEEVDDEEEEEELGAMKEMMYKIAALQPVEIDPTTLRRPKRRNVRISDDPQSVAARHRRERISEKMRILQRLVPGGAKLDTASMLDEAIRYVKFLKREIRQLQELPTPPLPPPPPPSAPPLLPPGPPPPPCGDADIFAAGELPMYFSYNEG